MKDTTGLWVYRVAFLSAIGLSIVLLDCTLQARAKWFPSYEEKLLAQMKQIENSILVSGKPKNQPRKAKAKMRAKRQSRKTA